jgi:signal transduction protein with GAF and PtsI domain
LGELRNDDEYLATLAERARQDAWSEIAEVINVRLAREWPEIEVDDTYLRERGSRVRGLELDLQRELQDVRRRREERDELDDSFGGWAG